MSNVSGGYITSAHNLYLAPITFLEPLLITFEHSQKKKNTLKK